MRTMFCRDWLAPLVAFFTLGSTGGAGQTLHPEVKALPRVESAAVPFYPTSWRFAGRDGSATLAVSTNGRKTSVVRLVSGDGFILAEAEKNIATWTFAEHRPSTFEVQFRYVLEGAECSTSDSGSMVILRLPREVEVRARSLGICEELAGKK
jgi:hypothetical protein